MTGLVPEWYTRSKRLVVIAPRVAGNFLGRSFLRSAQSRARCTIRHTHYLMSPPANESGPHVLVGEVLAKGAG